MFNGYYCNAYLGRYGFPPYEGDTEAYLAENPDAGSTWVWPYRDDQLMMKWNDAWLSYKDCDGDEVLDRYYGYESYIGSGAWLTNHQSGTYVNDDGKTCNWNYFVKIVAAPAADAYVDAPYDEEGHGTWYTADGTVIGYEIWGAFAVIEEVENDPCAGVHGIQYKPASPGLGCYQP